MFESFVSNSHKDDGGNTHTLHSKITELKIGHQSTFIPINTQCNITSLWNSILLLVQISLQQRAADG